MVDPGGMRALLELQARDTEADQLRHRRAHLPAAEGLDKLLAELGRLSTALTADEAERDELARRQSDLEGELADTERRQVDLDRRMKSGTVSAARDLQAMADQLASLRRRQSDLEDADLEVLEALEPVEARIATGLSRRLELDAQAGVLRAEIAEAEVDIDASLAAVAAARAAALSGVAPELVAAYERLRHRLGGVGAAPLVGASCGGCHLTLSASELDRISRLPADAVVTCDQCGRILVR